MTKTSASDSDAHKSATAVCGAGQGRGRRRRCGDQRKGCGHPHGLLPGCRARPRVTAEASESVVYGANWEVSAFAVCAHPSLCRRVDADDQRVRSRRAGSCGRIALPRTLDIGGGAGGLPRQRADAHRIEAAGRSVEERGCLQCRDPTVRRGWCRTTERHVARVVPAGLRDLRRERSSVTRRAAAAPSGCGDDGAAP